MFTTIAALGAGLFILACGWGMSNAAVVILGVALGLAAPAFLILSTLRGSNREYVYGTAHVHTVGAPPLPGAVTGRCEMHLLITAKGIDGEAVRVLDAAVPVSKWPDPGATLPVLVAAGDARKVRVLWDEVRSHGEIAAERGLYDEYPLAEDDGYPNYDTDTPTRDDLPPVRRPSPHQQSYDVPPPPAASPVEVEDAAAGFVGGDLATTAVAVDEQTPLVPMQHPAPVRDIITDDTGAVVDDRVTDGTGSYPGQFPEQTGDEQATQPETGPESPYGSAWQQPAPAPRTPPAPAQPAPAPPSVPTQQRPADRPATRAPQAGPAPAQAESAPEHDPIDAWYASRPGLPDAPEPASAETGSGSPSGASPSDASPDSASPDSASPDGVPAADAPPVNVPAARSAEQTGSDDDVEWYAAGASATANPAPGPVRPAELTPLARTAQQTPRSPEGRASQATGSVGTRRDPWSPYADADDLAEPDPLATPAGPATLLAVPSSHPRDTRPTPYPRSDQDSDLADDADGYEGTDVHEGAGVDSEPGADSPTGDSPTGDFTDTDSTDTDSTDTDSTDTDSTSAGPDTVSDPDPDRFLAGYLADDPRIAAPGIGGVAGVSVTLTVSNVARSIAFYRDIVGLTVIDSGDGTGILSSGDARVVLQQQPGMQQVDRRAVVHLNLEVDDVHESYQRLHDLGVEFISTPSMVSRGEQLEQWAATFLDPDGHSVTITRWELRV